MNSPQETSVDITYEAAQEQFMQLLAEYRHTALWFLKTDTTVSIENPGANRVLDAVAAIAPRSVWITTRKLKKWRSQHFR